jgi:glycine betaine/choline ABC-type transport system substrate-binding protein
MIMVDLNVRLMQCFFVLQAYLCVCDMLIIFSNTMAQNSPELEPLVYDAKKELQQKLMRFLNEKVFVEDDDGKNAICLF